MNFISTFIATHKIKIVIVGVLAIIAYGSTFIFGQNNPVEQGAETVIKEETGMNVDFNTSKK